MSALTMMVQFKQQLMLAWIARTEQERRFLGVGAALVLLALVYSILVAPALSGRARLRQDLPQLRQQQAQLQALALEAGELARAPQPQVVPMTRESLTASLAARSITPQSLSMTGEYAKLQLSAVSFANLVSWLDAQRREHRITVQDASITAEGAPGQVGASLTLHQDAGAAGFGTR
jgi:general secretion pathway protein M